MKTIDDEGGRVHKGHFRDDVICERSLRVNGSLQLQFSVVVIRLLPHANQQEFSFLPVTFTYKIINLRC